MAHGQYALYLTAMGRFEESLREHQLPAADDPLSLVGETNLGDTYYFARRYDEAVKQYRQVLELDANFALAQAGLEMAYIQQDKLQEAIVHLRRATQLDTDLEYEAILGYAYAVAGDETQARRMITQLAERAQKSYVSPAAVALIYLGMGKRSQACDWLERAYQGRDSNLAYIRIEPLWDRLRPDPCFKTLMQRMGVSH